VTYHVFNGTPVGQRLDDGYWEAHALCKAFGKFINHYVDSKERREFLDALTTDTGIPVSELIQVVKGGDPTKQGTWAHPMVMIDLGQWCDKKAHVKVTKAIYH
jgi:hypothetical protein